MPTVPLRTPMGNVPAEADEIIGSFALVNLSQYMPDQTIYFALSHVQSGWGWGAWNDKEVARRIAQELEREIPNWDEIYSEVDAGVRMQDMPERDILIRLYRRSFHDSHSLMPLRVAGYMPDVIIQEVEQHWASLGQNGGAAN